mmetsp:Transcript_43930/g.116086  ORF Transcript_43930/g.116086 Transcript_43930/m.116086 type:complete len:284 (-) Transcript_43930:30-881(-)
MRKFPARTPLVCSSPISTSNRFASGTNRRTIPTLPLSCPAFARPNISTRAPGENSLPGLSAASLAVLTSTKYRLPCGLVALGCSASGTTAAMSVKSTNSPPLSSLPTPIPTATAGSPPLPSSSRSFPGPSSPSPPARPSTPGPATPGSESGPGSDAGSKFSTRCQSPRSAQSADGIEGAGALAVVPAWREAGETYFDAIDFTVAARAFVATDAASTCSRLGISASARSTAALAGAPPGSKSRRSRASSSWSSVRSTCRTSISSSSDDSALELVEESEITLVCW